MSGPASHAGSGGGLPPGVRAIEHTADVGLEVRAPDLPTLFRRAAAGLEALLAGPPGGGGRQGPGGDRQGSGGDEAPPPARGGGDADRAGEVLLELDAPDLPLLLADWLRELLYLRQVRRRAIAKVEFEQLSETRLSARIQTTAAPRQDAREIKGVTYHGLSAERSGGEWRALVICDV